MIGEAEDLTMQVAVVGLGVAGMTVGMLLARQGHRVTVFEQTPEPGVVGAGVLLQPSGQMVLERLGLLEKVVALAEPIERLMAVTHRGGELIDLPYGELGEGIRAYGVHRGDLFSVLYAAMRAAGVEVRAGVRAVRMEKKTDGAVLIAENGARLGVFDFVVACDGARSAMRGNSGIPARVHEYPHGALWAIGRSERIRSGLWQVTEGTKRLCGLLPMGGGRCSLFWSLAREEREGFFEHGVEAWKREVLTLCPEARELMEGVNSFEETRYAGYFHVRMRRWFDERCVFLGDAAHAMSPHLGQGINLALIDGYVFARALAKTGNFQKACACYAQERRAHLNVYGVVTRMMSPFFQSRGVVKGLLRDLFLPLMPQFEPLRHEMLLTMAGLRAGWQGGQMKLLGDETRGESGTSG
jgi:2-polyprenyl-6-methoxyphenol hydroxylase-like FAD-dependent oxidoreductase